MTPVNNGRGRRTREERARRCIERLRHGCMLADYSLQGGEPEDAVAYLEASLRVARRILETGSEQVPRKVA